MSLDTVVRIFWMSLWMLVNATAITSGFILWKHPLIGGYDWPFGGGVLFIGLSSTLMWFFVLIDAVPHR